MERNTKSNSSDTLFYNRANCWRDALWLTRDPTQVDCAFGFSFQRTRGLMKMPCSLQENISLPHFHGLEISTLKLDILQPDC